MHAKYEEPISDASKVMALDMLTTEGKTGQKHSVQK